MGSELIHWSLLSRLFAPFRDVVDGRSSENRNHRLMNWIPVPRFMSLRKRFLPKQWRRFSPLITHSCFGACISKILSLFAENIIVSRVAVVFDWFYRQAWWSGKCRSRVMAGMSMSAAEVTQFAKRYFGENFSKAPLTEFSEAKFVEWWLWAAVSGSSEAGTETGIAWVLIHSEISQMRWKWLCHKGTQASPENNP